MTSFSHPLVSWWGSLEAASNDKAAKALWRRVDKNRLPDKTIAPEFPGAAGCKQTWEAVDQEFVDGWNSGQIPDHFLLLGKWPVEVDALHIFPGLFRIAKQQRTVLRAPRATLAWEPRAHTLHTRAQLWRRPMSGRGRWVGLRARVGRNQPH